MSPDRVIYSFVLGWVVLLAVLIALDWLGNPNRGTFRPKGERPPRDRMSRRAERARRRLEEDASVRAALRDAYGASSLRLTWSSEHESKARRLDDALIVEERADTVEVASREVATIDRTVVMGDPLPNIAEDPPVAVTDDGTDNGEAAVDADAVADTGVDVDADADADADGAQDAVDASPEPEEVPVVRPRGWKVGGDPLSLTARGSEPAPTTIRSRVWKNHGADGAWSAENLARLEAGKPPRRVNPINGRHERAMVDLESGRASWGSDPVDPFGDPT